MLSAVTLADDGFVTLAYECGHAHTLPAVEGGHPPRVLWVDGRIASFGNGPDGSPIDEREIDAIMEHMALIDAYAEREHTRPGRRPRPAPVGCAGTETALGLGLR